MMRILKTLFLGFLAGVMIAIGGLVFFSCNDKYVGALAFSVGLFFICEFMFFLYTGKVGRLIDYKPRTGRVPLTLFLSLSGTSSDAY